MSSKGKVRLTELLVSRGFFADAAQAQRAILAGEVVGANAVLTQPGMLVSPDIDVRVKAPRRFVSRGGDKLAGALEAFCCDPCGMHCLDVGASTGGFTHCLLQQGAASVVAVDVAYGQFAWQLRCDERVTLFERTNIRELNPASATAPFDLVVCDLSFTSLRSALPALVAFFAPGGYLVALVKPQFELDSALVGNGVVTNADAHIRALELAIMAAVDNDLAPQNVCFSPIRGQKGNIEFFLYAQQGGIPATIDISTVVGQAHERLDLMS